jgi:putative intracellular protease/amidase
MNDSATIWFREMTHIKDSWFEKIFTFRFTTFMNRYLLNLLSLLLLASFANATQPILIVVTNHDRIADTGTPTGYYLSEVAHPWHVFTDAGYEVEFASPKGGFAPMDPKSFDLSDPINKAFWHDLKAVQGLVHTQALPKLNPKAYAAIFFAGGHGTMWDFPKAKSVRKSIAKHYKNGGGIGAVCHGPAALVDVKIDGKPLVQGKEVAAFTDEEEAAVQLTEAMPFLLESKLRELGANFVEAENFQPKVAVSERLVTGQNPASATGAAEAVLKLLD